MDAPAIPGTQRIAWPAKGLQKGLLQVSLRLTVEKQEQLVRSLALVMLFALPGILCLHVPVVADADLWWHLSSGQWIFQHHAIPHTDPFSAYGAGKFWAAYSWLFEVIVFWLFQKWGLVGVVAFTAGMLTIIMAALYRLIQRLLPDFVLSAFLTVAVMYCLLHFCAPRPWLFTILFFILEFDILMQARRTGGWRGLLLLPLLFAFWANTHIEFVPGLMVLGLATIEPVMERWWPAKQTRLRSVALWPILGACVAATLVNPYGWRIYDVAYQLVAMPGAANYVAEMSAIPFRTPNDFVLLFLALVCAGALCWTRRIPFFEVAVFALAVTVSFRNARELWFLAVVAAAILASVYPAKQQALRKLPELALVLIVVASGAVLWGIAVYLHIDNAQLQDDVAEQLPVRAVAAIKEGHYRGPLFNSYNWGGYLIWDLRMPVSIDGRANVFGDELITRNINTWEARPDWDSNPEFASAGIVIGPLDDPLAQVLRLDSRFQLVYEDKIAVVFLRRAFQDLKNP
jgi:hypothetical protein